MRSSAMSPRLAALAAVLGVAALMVAAAWLSVGDPAKATGNSITSPDTLFNVGAWTSLVLDGADNPVVSYDGTSTADPHVLHCGDPNCSAGNTITFPDSANTSGLGTSITLDSLGYPVVAYTARPGDDLKVLHCNDPSCAGGDESVVTPDATGDTGRYPSIVLDAAGNPVVSYVDFSNNLLRILHCDDPNCAPGGDVISTPDALPGVAGAATSLALDAAGNPVVSYYNAGSLKVLHCDDPNCSGGGDSITSPDASAITGWMSTLVLDAAGNPVVSYLDITNRDLKILHCSDPDCAPGGDSITTPDSVGEVGEYPALALDGSGFPRGCLL